MPATAHKRQSRKGLSRSPRKVEVRIVMPRRQTYWSLRRLTALLVLAVVVGINAAVFAQSPQTKAAMPLATAAPRQDKTAEPFDIVLDGASPEQKDMDAAAGAQKSGQLEVHVPADDEDAVSPEDAEARKLMHKADALKKQGDYKKALRLAHKAAALAPDNMQYRLELATLYDRSGAQKGALALYHQVLDAFDAGDESLADETDIEAVRTRAEYLEATAAMSDLQQVAEAR